MKFNKSAEESVLQITVTGFLNTKGYMFKDIRQAEKLLSPISAMNELSRNGLNIKLDIRKAK